MEQGVASRDLGYSFLLAIQQKQFFHALNDFFVILFESLEEMSITIFMVKGDILTWYDGLSLLNEFLLFENSERGNQLSNHLM